jgi:hypothetical protein
MLTISGSVLGGDLRKYFEQVPVAANKAAALAINQVVDRAFVPMIRKQAEQEINFPNGYLQQADRLAVTRRATSTRLEAVVTARDRATSLARFAPGFTPENSRKNRVVVRVQRKGKSIRLSNNAWIARLNNGNVGLAVRLGRGEKPTNTEGAVLVKAWSGVRGNVYLLYGPSVDQVIKTIAIDALPDAGDRIAKEFMRQFQRLTSG